LKVKINRHKTKIGMKEEIIMNIPLINNNNKICPFCFEEFNIQQTPFRCSSPPSVCKYSPDPILTSKWNISMPVANVISPTGSSVKQVRCPICQNHTGKRICPKCHQELPPTIGEYKNYIFSIIGAKESGKSHYIAVLIDYFKRRVGPSFKVLLEPVNDYTIKRYKDSFYNPIFRKKEVILGTASGLANAEVRLPLIYSLVFSGKGIFGKQKITRCITLSFFDTAGEDLNDQDIMSVTNKYIYRSDGIILLFDPLQISYVRDQLAGKVDLPEQNTETEEIINRTTNLIRNAYSIPMTKSINIPLAIAFSKIDALDRLLPPESQLSSDSSHEGKFDVKDCRAVDDEVQAFIDNWEQGEALINQVKTNFADNCFFGLSALGCNPHRTGKIPNVIPRRVADPFLWLLHNKKLIESNG